MMLSERSKSQIIIRIKHLTKVDGKNNKMQGFPVSSAGGPGSIPGQETIIRPHIPQLSSPASSKDSTAAIKIWQSQIQKINK